MRKLLMIVVYFIILGISLKLYELKLGLYISIGFYITAVYVAYMLILEPIEREISYSYSSGSFNNFGIIGKSFIIIFVSLIVLSFLMAFIAFIDLIIFQLIFNFSILKKLIPG